MYKTPLMELCQEPAVEPMEGIFRNILLFPFVEGERHVHDRWFIASPIQPECEDHFGRGAGGVLGHCAGMCRRFHREA